MELEGRSLTILPDFFGSYFAWKGDRYEILLDLFGVKEFVEPSNLWTRSLSIEIQNFVEVISWDFNHFDILRYYLEDIFLPAFEEDIRRQWGVSLDFKHHHFEGCLNLGGGAFYQMARVFVEVDFLALKSLWSKTLLNRNEERLCFASCCHMAFNHHGLGGVAPHYSSDWKEWGSFSEWDENQYQVLLWSAMSNDFRWNTFYLLEGQKEYFLENISKGFEYPVDKEEGECPLQSLKKKAEPIAQLMELKEELLKKKHKALVEKFKKP